MTSETYLSVDVEASGPIPGEYSLLSLGACLVGNTAETFYVELRPITNNYIRSAVEVSGLSLAELQKRGVEPATAMAEFERWIQRVTPEGGRPVFVAFNATFDWMFTHYYFIRFLGRDPFGISGLDIKAYYAGLTGAQWGDTTKGRLHKRFKSKRRHTHNACDDAIEQAEVFEKMLAEARGRDRSADAVAD
ncbi:MAG: 3'-5' exonuclease [Chloroflexi bacterium]|nr:3'-5' exonuclease [Chloroflexota bacterium]